MYINIGMPLYNTKVEFIQDAIDSIRNQTYTDWKLIICDDCSRNEDTINFLKSLKNDKKITIIRNIKNEGIAPTRKKIIENLDTDYKYLAFLDSDDMMTPARLEIQVEYMDKNTDVDILGSQIAIYPNGGILPRRAEYWNGRFITNHPIEINEEIVRNSFWFINNPSCIIRRNVLEKIEYPAYDHDPFGLADYEFFCKCYASGFKIRNIKDCLTIYRLHEKQISNSNFNKLKEQKLKNIKNKYILS